MKRFISSNMKLTKISVLRRFIKSNSTRRPRSRRPPRHRYAGPPKRIDESKGRCVRRNLQTRPYALLVSVLKRLISMDVDVDILRTRQTLPQILDIGHQCGRDTPLSLDKMKFERLTYLF